MVIPGNLPPPEARRPTQTQGIGEPCNENDEDANDHQRLGERGILQWSPPFESYSIT